MEKTKKQDKNEAKLAEHEKKLNEYVDSLKRLQAEFENYIKRSEKEKQEFVSYSNHKLITKLLTIVDNFDKAIDIMKENKGNHLEGIEMIYNQFHKILQEEGVYPINAKGNKLDPFKHEVIDLVAGNEDELVIDELQKGYMIKDKVLRPSRVRITKCTKIDGEKDTEEEKNECNCS